MNLSIKRKISIKSVILGFIGIFCGFLELSKILDKMILTYARNIYIIREVCIAIWEYGRSEDAKTKKM